MIDTTARSPLISQWNLEEIRYSFVWEDYRLPSVQLAQKNQQKARALCIASSGENGLSLLAEHDIELTLIDLSLAQVALTELKLEALKTLDHSQFMNFFFDKGFTGRAEIGAMLLPRLSEKSQLYWQQNQGLLSEGVLDQGRLERYFEEFRKRVLPEVWTKNQFQSLVSATTLEQQAKIWSSGKLELLAQLARQFFSQESLSTQGRHTSQFKYVTTQDTGSLFLKRFSNLLSRQLISKNPYLYLFMTGEPLTSKDVYPLWDADGYKQIQRRSGQVEIIHGDLEGYLSQGQLGYDLMVLSDVFEYLSEEESEALFSLCAQSLSTGGELGYWSLLVDRQPLGTQLRANQELSSRLTAQDRTWFYSRYHVLERG